MTKYNKMMFDLLGKDGIEEYNEDFFEMKNINVGDIFVIPTEFNNDNEITKLEAYVILSRNRYNAQKEGWYQYKMATDSNDHELVVTINEICEEYDYLISKENIFLRNGSRIIFPHYTNRSLSSDCNVFWFNNDNPKVTDINYKKLIVARVPAGTMYYEELNDNKDD